MNKMTKILALVLAVLMIVPAIVACNKPTDNPTPNPAENPTEAPVDNPTEAPVDNPTEVPATDVPVPEGEYTYHLAMGANPSCWNPHAWQMSNESTLMSYIEAPFVDLTIAEDGVNFMWVFEMATGLTDVTATYADREKWLDEDDEGNLPTEHYIYKIDLNPDAKWEDGTPITSADYIYSMQQMLSSEMKNYRANTYFDGDTAIKNSKAYYMNDLVGQPIYEKADASIEEGPFYVDLTQICVFFGSSNTPKDYYDAGYAPYFVGVDGTDVFETWAANEGWTEVTPEIQADIENMTANFNDDVENWKEWCYYIAGTYEETPWEDVGLVAEGDYTIYYINQNPVTEFYMKTALTSNWLVYKDLYEAGKKTVENLVTTDYGTSKETYMATGPYRLDSFEPDKQFILVRNENWFGWNDGKHVGQYQTTRVIYDIIAEHSTALMAFNRGDLDEVALESDDLEIYKMSNYLLKTDETYTQRFIFATDPEKLQALEAEAGDGANKQVLQYDDFRKAISLSINRTEFCANCTSGFKPAYFLLNNLYYYDIENNTESQYRNTDAGREAVLRLYGIEYGDGTAYPDAKAAFAAVTGYDVDAAKELFKSVYDQAIADGTYTPGQLIKINCEASASALSAEDTRQQEYLTQYVAAATEGTGFEGKISFNFLGNIEKRYEDVALGKIEMIRGAWGGAAFYPFSTIRVYCEPDYMGGLTAIHESCGWDPTVETMTVELDGEEITDTLQNWAKSMNGAGQYAQDKDTCLIILSNLETAILSSYQCIPTGTYTDCSLFSKKINYATTTYNIMYGYGGVRLMTYNFNDEQWEAFKAEQGGEIDYK
ncbi:MAG: hypothetical protein IK064_00085 [Clostridia bacterium]|nr:hypothetical protein [Clostridia bacterium]